MSKVGVWGTSFLCGAALCIGNLLNGASAAEQRVASQSDESRAERELERLTKEIEALEKRWTITQGSYRTLTIGESKEQVLSGLREIGVRSVRPNLAEQTRVTTPEDLPALKDAQGVIIGPGSVTISFIGDEVQRVRVAPIYPEWQELLRGITTRREAFEALAQILESSKGVTVRAHAPDAKQVGILPLTLEGKALLDKYDHWRVPHDVNDGYIHLTLEFSEGVLRSIAVLESPSAL